MDLADFFVAPDLGLAVLHLQEAAVAVGLAVAGAQRRELQGAKLGAGLEVELGLDLVRLVLLDDRLDWFVQVELFSSLGRLARPLHGEVDDLVGLALLEVELTKVRVGLAVGATNRALTVGAFTRKKRNLMMDLRPWWWHSG